MTVADRIIEACGGVQETARLAGCKPNWVYRWRLPKERGGTDGQVPPSAARAILAAAAKPGGPKVSPADFFDIPAGDAA